MSVSESVKQTFLGLFTRRRSTKAVVWDLPLPRMTDVPAGQLDVVTLSGPEVRQSVWRRLERDLRSRTATRPVVLDLTQVQSMTARGIRTILRCRDHVRSRQSTFAVSGLNGQLRTLFQVLRLHTLIDVFTDPAEAGSALLPKQQSATEATTLDGHAVRRTMPQEKRLTRAKAALGGKGTPPTPARPILIGIAGGSCAGKTTLAQALGSLLGEGNTTVVELDSYYRGVPEGAASAERHNFDEPDALDAELLLRHLRALADGEAVRAPIYDFATHRRAERTQLLLPRPFIVVEGLFALYWNELRELIDLGVFVDAHAALSLERRVRRDVAERDRRAEEVSQQFRSVVRPMHLRHVQPTRELADLVVAGGAPIDDSLDAIVSSLHAYDSTSLKVSG